MSYYTVCEDTICTADEVRQECEYAGKSYARFQRVFGKHTHYIALRVLKWLYR